MFRPALPILLLLTFATQASAIDVCGQGRRITCTVDGDTIWWRGEKIRILGLDAPEISQPACAAELEQGLMALQALNDLIGDHEVHVHREGVDRYGRTLANLTVRGNDVAASMIAAGVAQPYEDRAAGWCGR